MMLKENERLRLRKADVPIIPQIPASKDMPFGSFVRLRFNA